MLGGMGTVSLLRELRVRLNVFVTVSNLVIVQQLHGAEVLGRMGQEGLVQLVSAVAVLLLDVLHEGVEALGHGGPPVGCPLCRNTAPAEAGNWFRNFLLPTAGDPA